MLKQPPLRAARRRSYDAAMNTRSAAQIRQEFIDYFVKKRGHTFVPSSPCVPHDDPTLMFTNAGMNQFKDVFLDTGSRSFKRAANTQKCIRAGGKHNDLDDVGHDTYHHTFFEMLGNWSFGDYFKKEAIAWAWDLLTNVWGVDPQRLHATYFGGAKGSRGQGAQGGTEDFPPDEEARDLWLKVLPPERVHPGNMKDNFWEMGDTGPCGPCSEIHIDLTPDKSGGSLVNAGDARVMEIWNLVFIQFNRAADGKLTPLPAKHVDTGMGFERITALLQGKKSNYDTDIFTPIFAAIQRVTGAPAYTGKLEAVVAAGAPAGRDSGSDQSRDREGAPSDPQIMVDVAYRVVADHLRTLTFALTDGATPSNEGRGYVLRRILRRAVRYGRQYLGTHEPFICKLVPAVVDGMGEAFPELKKNPQHVAEIIRDEERSFIKTLDRGIALFEEIAVPRETLRRHVMSIAATISSASPNLLNHQIDLDLLKKHCEELVQFVRSFRDQQPWRSPFGELSACHHTLSDYVAKGDQQSFEFEVKKLPKECAQLLSSLAIPGADAFRLHDTYGFPIDLTELMAKERGLTVDIGEYERLMELARDRARGKGLSYGLDAIDKIRTQYERVVELGPTNEGLKYSTLRVADARLLGILWPVPDGRFSTQLCEEFDTLKTSEYVALILDRTCFYAEQGGQVSDIGIIRGSDGEFAVEATIRLSDTIVHLGRLIRGRLVRDQAVELEVQEQSRHPTMQNHTATHVMNWALREVLGEHVQQKGSLVDPDKTRFDFSHPSQVTEEELSRIEELVNSQIEEDLEVFTAEADQKKAREVSTLRAVFGEKYPDEVRVVSVGVPVEQLLDDPKNDEWMRYSVEFCGGTHVKRTSEIKRFRLVEESAVAKGIRRVTGVTAEHAERVEKAAADLARRIAEAKKKDDAALPTVVAELTTTMNETELPVTEKARLRAELAELQERAKKAAKMQAKVGAADILAKADQVLESAPRAGATAIIAADMGTASIDQLRSACDSLRSRAGSAAILLAAAGDGKVLLLAAMTQDVVSKGLKAGDLIKEIAPIVGGKGGGKPDLAQGGGSDVGKIPEAIVAAAAWLRGKLS